MRSRLNFQNFYNFRPASATEVPLLSNKRNKSPAQRSTLEISSSKK